jgi:hypothetical protein
MQLALPLRRTLAAAGLALAMLAASAAPAAAAGEGDVRFVKDASSDFDSYTSSPSSGQAQWMRDHFDRSKVYASYFDSRTSWYPSGWSYRDLYAIYKGSSVATQHPEWILKDAQGRNLYIPYGCGGGSCPQFAGDVGSPSFRASWIDSMRQRLSAGSYKGIYIDDVNMRFRVGDGNGDGADPIDPRTGQVMSFTTWRRYVAEFVEQVRAAFPSHEIVHNAIWYSDQSDQYVKRAHQAADYVDLERGVTDDGIRGGGGTWGYETYLGYVDKLHALGKSVVFDSYAEDRAGAEYNVASYLLVNESRDGVGTSYRNTPDDWWSAGYDLDLGAAKGRRYVWNGLLRRDFDDGYVLVNQPDASRKTVSTPGAIDLDGAAQPTTTLGDAEGVVLRGALATPPVDPGSIVLDPVPNPVKRRPATGGDVTTKRRGKRKAKRAHASRMRHAVLLRGKVRKGRHGKVTLVVKRKTRGGAHTVRRTTARVSANGRFTRLVRSLKPARYVVVASYAKRSGVTVPLRKRHFKIRY